MKKRILIIGLTLLFIIGASSATLYAVAPRELFNFRAPSQEERLPSEALTFVNSNYPESRIVNVDLELLGYEVYLDNGTIIEFDFDGSIDVEDEDEENYDQDSEDIVVAYDTVPEFVSSYIETNYPNQTVILVEQDDDGYDVYLSNGLEIEFDFDGSIDVEDEDEEDEDDWNDWEDTIEFSSLPEIIINYISANYPGLNVLKVEWEDNEYEVTFTNQLELTFNSEGLLIEVDKD